MLFLLVLELAFDIIGFMLQPLLVVFPFEVVSIIYTFLNYITSGLQFVTFFSFDAWVLRSVFGFVLSLNVGLLAFDLIWRIISYIKISTREAIYASILTYKTLSHRGRV